MVDPVQDIVSNYANRRSNLHNDHLTQRPLSEGYDEVGMTGEFAFGVDTGLMPDLSDKPRGDNGVDFRIKLYFSVDVKTARIPKNLIHEKGKPFVDIYVLARYDDVTKSATLIGWEWGSKLKQSPTKDFGYGVINHYIPANELRDMDSLYARMEFY